MALFGPAPAVAIGVVSTIAESIVNRVPLRQAFANILDVRVPRPHRRRRLRSDALLDRSRASRYGLCAAGDAHLRRAGDAEPRPRDRLSTPACAGASFATPVCRRYPLSSSAASWPARRSWSGPHAGLTAAAALLVVLVITIPLVRSVGDALMRGDDLAVLPARVGSSALPRWRDCRATASVCSRRCSTQSSANGHDSQSRSTTARCNDWSRSARTQPRRTTRWRRRLDKADRETRAIISSFHPASVRELGFEASLRAAVTPFPARRVREPDRRERHRRPGAGGHAAGSDRPGAGRERGQARQANHDPRPDQSRRTVRSCSTLTTTVSESTTSASRRAVQAGHLGLAMVRRRVEDVGGSLEIATRADGGTHSRVILPAARG